MIRLEMPPQAPLAKHRWRATVRDLAGGTVAVREGKDSHWNWWECALSGAAELLSSVPEGCKVVFFGPAKPIYFGMTQWVANWMRNGWLTKRGTPACFREQWERLLKLSMTRTVVWWPIEPLTRKPRPRGDSRTELGIRIGRDRDAPVNRAN